MEKKSRKKEKNEGRPPDEGYHKEDHRKREIKKSKDNI